MSFELLITTHLKNMHTIRLLLFVVIDHWHPYMSHLLKYNHSNTNQSKVMCIFYEIHYTRVVSYMNIPYNKW